MNNNHTAIDWLVEKINTDCTSSVFILPETIAIVKQMEKEQILDAFNVGLVSQFYNSNTRHPQEGYVSKAEEYYNETYKTDKK